ncbi:hypothetical protein KI387_041158, partial [Taxus chinensis]
DTKSGRHESLIANDDDKVNQLMHLALESYVFSYLGLEKIKVSNTIMDESYFNPLYKLELVCTSEGNFGKTGVGIVPQIADDSVTYKVMVGLGTTMKVLAKFHALMLGLRAPLDRGIYHIQDSRQFTFINGLQEHLCVKDVMDLVKEANALINTFKTNDCVVGL